MFDVGIIGGGPAGAALALRAARLGRRVVLIEKSMFPRRHVGESLTGGILPLLEILGVRNEVENAGFLPAPRATVLWAGQLRHRDTPGGYQVDRARFDRLLLEAARQAHVEIHQPVRVVSTAFGKNWQLNLDNGSSLHCRFLADARGKSPAQTPSGAPKIKGTPCLALYACWNNVAAGEADTLVEAGVSQWYWGAPIPDEAFIATVFVDPAHARKNQYLTLIHQSKLFADRLANGRCGEVGACSATPIHATSPVSTSAIKVGDAALSIDPLSSQGVTTAIGTALHAAVVLNTLLDRPEDSQLAMDFYRQRLGDSSKFHSRSASTLYREQCAFTDTEFWRARVGDEPTRVPFAPETWRLDQQIRLSPGVSFKPVAIATERYVTSTPGVDHQGKTFAYVGGRPIAEFLHELATALTVRELAARWSQKMPINHALQLLEWSRRENLIAKAY